MSEVPGVARRALQRRIGQRLPAEFRRRGLAHQHDAGGAEAAGDRRILGGRRLVGGVRAVARRPAFDRRGVLDRGRHAVERRQRRTFGPARLGLPGRRARALGVDQHEGVEMRLQPLGAVQCEFHRLDRREFLARIAAGEVGSGKPGKIIDHGNHPYTGLPILSHDSGGLFFPAKHGYSEGAPVGLVSSRRGRTRMTEVKIGSGTAVRIEESYEPNFAAKTFFADWRPEVVEEHRAWMVPNHYDEASGWLKLSIHSWLLRVGGKNILIDTCVGNHKSRAARPKWDMMETRYLERLEATGVGPDQID